MARGGEITALEGDWAPAAIIIIVEFPDKETAMAWYRSAEDAEALSIRDQALNRSLILVDGIGGVA